MRREMAAENKEDGEVIKDRVTFGGARREMGSIRCRRREGWDC